MFKITKYFHYGAVKRLLGIGSVVRSLLSMFIYNYCLSIQIILLLIILDVSKWNESIFVKYIQYLYSKYIFNSALNVFISGGKYNTGFEKSSFIDCFLFFLIFLNIGVSYDKLKLSITKFLIVEEDALIGLAPY